VLDLHGAAKLDHVFRAVGTLDAFPAGALGPLGFQLLDALFSCHDDYLASSLMISIVKVVLPGAIVRNIVIKFHRKNFTVLISQTT
jgi:hypothetical protein